MEKKMLKVRVVKLQVTPILVTVDTETLEVIELPVSHIEIAGADLDRFPAELRSQIRDLEASINPAGDLEVAS